MVRLRPLGVDSRFAGRPAENASTPHTPPLNRLLARTETSGADEFYGRGQGLLLTSGGQSGHGRAQRYPAVTPLIHPYPSHTSPPHASTFTTGAARSPPAVFRDLNRPGVSGGLVRWKDHSHGTTQQVPDRTA